MTAFPETAQIRALSDLAMRLSLRLWRCDTLALAVAACVAGPASATLISFDTTTLAGTPARLDFSLLDGDGVLGNNAVTIASIATDGSLGAVDCTIGCGGGPPFTITEAFGLGQFLQDLTLGTSVSFDLGFTANFSGSGVPDRLSLLLLDPTTNFTLVDTNLDFPNDPVPVQDALLIVDLVPGTQIQLATVSDPSVPGPATEPGAAGLIALGLGVLTGQRIRRRRARE
jgi:hypothetical protein